MIFLNPEYFWFFLLLMPVFIKRNYREFSFNSWGYILTFVFIVFALCRPVIEQEPVKSQRVLSDVIVAVDLSYSMHAEDIKPSRLKRAKEILKELVDSQKNTRFAVLGFTTNAIILSPLTQDSELLLHLYDSLDENLIVTRGSSIMPALELASKMSKSKTPNVVILTDGADELSYENEAKFAKDRGMRVNVLMLATEFGTTLKAKNGELLKDEFGDLVVSRANNKISQISKLTNGIFSTNIDEIKDALENQRDKEHKTNTTIVQNIELFYYAVVLSIIAFLITVTTLKRYVIISLLFFGVNLNADIADKFYDSIDKNRGYFNKAVKYYQNAEYEKALVNFEMVKSDNEELKSIVFYNIGNSYVRVKEFKKAREAYLKSLTLMYSKEADENLRYIKDADEQKHMSAHKQKSENKSQLAKQEKDDKNSKEGSSSNMKVSAPSSSGASKIGKKVKNESMLNLNSSKTKLSSKQYELINKRGVDEKKPW